ncbi:MAG: hypothetical protein ABFR36_07865 [Acidobacteriota bacterium]
MKDSVPENGNKENNGSTDSENTTGSAYGQTGTFGSLSSTGLKEIIYKNRKFFRVSAEASINSN